MNDTATHTERKLGEEVPQPPEEQGGGSGIPEDQYVDIPAPLLLGFCKYGMMVGRNLKNKGAHVSIVDMAMKVRAAADIDYRMVIPGNDPGVWFLEAMTHTANMLKDKLDEQAATKLLTPSKKLVVAGAPAPQAVKA